MYVNAERTEDQKIRYIVYGLFKRDGQPLHMFDDIVDYCHVNNFR